MLIDYYVDLFTSSNPHNLESILDGIQEVVTWEMNSNLTAPYTVEEMEIAIKDMASLKALGSEGMPHYSTRLTGIMLVWISLKLFYLVLILALF